jgi:hypothetical protein
MRNSQAANRLTGIPLFLLLMMTPAAIVLHAGPQAASAAPVTPTASESCVQSVQNQLAAIPVNSAAGLALAEASPSFQTATQAVTSHYTGMSFGWHVDKSCQLDSVQVSFNFALSNSTGLLVTENTATSQVLSVESTGPLITATAATSSIWSGWDFTDSITYSGVFYSTISYDQPTVSDPDPSGNYCSNPHCVQLMWTGLTGASDGSTGIAQAGTAAAVTTSGGSSTETYNMWTEFWCTGSSDCQGSIQECADSAYTGAGDQIVAYSESYALGGGSYDYYSVSAYDNHTNYGCSQIDVDFSSMGYSWYANDILEQPSGFQWPDFNSGGSFSVSGTVYYSGNYYGISTPYNAAAYVGPMDNYLSGTEQANPTTPSSNSFSEVYDTSV